MMPITATQVSILGALLSGMPTAAHVPDGLVAGLTAAAGVLFSDVPQIDRATIDVVWPRFAQCAAPTPAFFFRPRQGNGADEGDIGFLVPREANLSASHVTLGGGPSVLHVLCPLPSGPSAEISASVFCGIEGRPGEYRKVLHGREQGPPAGTGREPVDVPRLHRMLGTVISDVASGGVSSHMAGRLERAGFKTVGQLVLAAEDRVVKALNFAGRGGRRRSKFNSWLACLSERAGIPLRLGMDTDDLHGWGQRVAALRPFGAGVSRLEAVLNRKVGDLGMTARSVAKFRRAGLLYVGAILQLDRETLRIKVGKSALARFLDALAVLSEETSCGLHLSMTSEEMHGWPRRHGRPVTTGTSVGGDRRRRA